MWKFYWKQFALETLERVSIVWGAGQMDLMCHWRRLAAHKSWRSLLPFTRSWKSRRFHFSCKWASIFGANGFFFIQKNGGRCLFVFFIFSLKRKRKKKSARSLVRIFSHRMRRWRLWPLCHGLLAWRRRWLRRWRRTMRRDTVGPPPWNWSSLQWWRVRCPDDRKWRHMTRPRPATFSLRLAASVWTCVRIRDKMTLHRWQLCLLQRTNVNETVTWSSGM